MRIWNTINLFGTLLPKQWSSMRLLILQNLKAALNESNIFRYEIRTNPSFVVTPSTTELYSSPASCRESVGHWSGVFPIETGESCPVNQYYYSGFVAIQALFDFTKIRVSFKHLHFTQYMWYPWCITNVTVVYRNQLIHTFTGYRNNLTNHCCKNHMSFIIPFLRNLHVIKLSAWGNCRSLDRVWACP